MEKLIIDIAGEASSEYTIAQASKDAVVHLLLRFEDEQKSCLSCINYFIFIPIPKERMP